MTTLQTLLSRNEGSAGPAVQRAQTEGIGADDAQGFEGIFDEKLSESPDSEPQEDANESANPEKTDAKPDAVAANPDAVDEQDVPIEIPLQVHSIGDLTGQLTNAAAIDLAGLATQELEGQKQNLAKTDPAQTRQEGAQAESTKPEANLLSQLTKSHLSGHGQERLSPQDQQRLIQNLSQGSETVTHETESGPSVTKTGLNDQASQKQVAAQQLEGSQQSSQPVRVPIAQSAQTVQVAHTLAAEFIRNSRSLDGVRSINETAGFASKSRAITGSESSSNAGSGQGELDLGNGSKNTARILQTRQPEDDRAVQRQQVMAQVQRGLASIMNTKGGSMKLRLSPEHLGEVNIQLTTKDGHVSVKIEAKNDETRNMLKDGLDSLRSAMESRGVRVDDLSMDSRERSEFQRMFGDSDQDGSNSHQNQSGAQGDPHNQSSDHSDKGDGKNPVDELGMDERTESNEPRVRWTELGLDAIA